MVPLPRLRRSDRSTAMQTSWDAETDLVVVGSGGGLVGALAARAAGAC